MSQPGSSPRSEMRRHWPVVLACFSTAIFAWGFGFYGQSVYLAELRHMHGWPSSVIASATTTFYLAGAAILTRVHILLDRLGPRALLAGGALLLGLGVTLFSRAEAPWHLYPAAIVMACGWACCSSTAISTTLALWFDRQRGLAISLALNGASAAGFTVAPLLVLLSRGVGLVAAVTGAVVVCLLFLLPLIVFGTRAVPAGDSDDATPIAPERATTRQALRDPHFWSVALPFALALAAQVGFIVHLVAFLSPRLGSDGTAAAVSIAAGAAMAGRIGLGLVIDRLNQRRAAAASFASQAAALALMLAMPDAPVALYAGSLVFGLSVGNVITLPALIVQREFPRPLFGLIVGLSNAFGQMTFAFGPALLGVLRDATGGYGVALVLCMVLELAAAAIVLRGPARVAAPAGF